MAQGDRSRLVQHDEPEWGPLVRLVGEDLAGWFMWMHELELADGTRVHEYKHRATRRYLRLAKDGRAFDRTLAGDYVPTGGFRAVLRVLERWEPPEEPESWTGLAVADRKLGPALDPPGPVLADDGGRRWWCSGAAVQR